MKLDFVDNCVSADAAKLILRVSIGVLLLLHGIYKLQNPEALDFIGGLFNDAYLPAFLAYLVYIGEIVAPIMLIIGYRVKLAAALVAVLMIVAILLAHTSQLFTLGTGGGSALEIQFLFLFGAIAIMGLGAGKYAIRKRAAVMSA